MRNWVLAICIAYSLGSCIGTDLVDAPVVGESLVIMPDRIALLIGNDQEATATYYNPFGVVEEVEITWKTEPTNIATVDVNGKVTAVSPGQAMLFAMHGELMASVRIAVVLDENSAASVDISAEKTSLANGESMVLSALVKNIDEQPITTSTVMWQSSDETVITVASDGTATAVGNGIAKLFAIVDGVYSNEIEVIVGGIRTGTFVPANGYNASGTATLKLENQELILEFSDDFMTSFALGTFIYLSNNNVSGTAIRSEGIELGEINSNGTHTFNVTQSFPNVTLSQYQYVVILCKPASIPFGYAIFN